MVGERTSTRIHATHMTVGAGPWAFLLLSTGLTRTFISAEIFKDAAGRVPESADGTAIRNWLHKGAQPGPTVYRRLLQVVELHVGEHLRGMGDGPEMEERAATLDGALQRARDLLMKAEALRPRKKRTLWKRYRDAAEQIEGDVWGMGVVLLQETSTALSGEAESRRPDHAAAWRKLEHFLSYRASEYEARIALVARRYVDGLRPSYRAIETGAREGGAE